MPPTWRGGEGGDEQRGRLDEAHDLRLEIAGGFGQHIGFFFGVIPAVNPAIGGVGEVDSAAVVGGETGGVGEAAGQLLELRPLAKTAGSGRGSPFFIDVLTTRWVKLFASGDAAAFFQDGVVEGQAGLAEDVDVVEDDVVGVSHFGRVGHGLDDARHAVHVGVGEEEVAAVLDVQRVGVLLPPPLRFAGSGTPSSVRCGGRLRRGCGVRWKADRPWRRGSLRGAGRRKPRPSIQRLRRIPPPPLLTSRSGAVPAASLAAGPRRVAGGGDRRAGGLAAVVGDRVRRGRVRRHPAAARRRRHPGPISTGVPENVGGIGNAAETQAGDKGAALGPRRDGRSEGRTWFNRAVQADEHRVGLEHQRRQAVIARGK